MSVRALGHYSSWLHVVENLPATSSGINIYDWIQGYTQQNYGYRWSATNPQGKKLNAILTVPAGTIITGPTRPATQLLNDNPGATEFTPAIEIDNRFRSFDRITIINRGRLIGSLGYKDYSGSGDFKPPAEVTEGGVIKFYSVGSVNLDVAAGGGDGGKCAGGAGASGGGGGAGGRKIQTLSVLPGLDITASGGSRRTAASYSQNGNVIITASPGGDGGDARQGGIDQRCNFIDWGQDCLNVHTPGTGGTGGGGGSPNGQRGADGERNGERYFRSGTADPTDKAAGGSGQGGPGGYGGGFRNDCDGGLGSAGWHLWSYTRTELYGPAVKNKHTNVRILNDGGIIMGGYTLNGIFSMYGTSGIENISTIGGTVGVSTHRYYPTIDNTY